jgi:3-methyladenine DNA glycosylase AlkD
MPTSALASTLLERVSSAFESNRDEERARSMAAYMRDQFPFVGIPTPARITMREDSKTDAEAVVRFVDAHHDELSGLTRSEALKWLHRRGAA